MSGLPSLEGGFGGDELLLVTKNKQSLKATAGALKAYVNNGMATETAVRAVSDRLDRLIDGSASDVIDTFNEIEAFLRGITDSQTLTGLLAELKSAITGEYTQALADKVDKVEGKGLSANDYTDEEKRKLELLPGNGQFGRIGYYVLDGGTYAPSTTYRTSGMLPLNRNHDLVYRAFAGGAASSLAFFSADGTAISTTAIKTDPERTVAKEDFPKDAVYFAVSTAFATIDSSYYRNGETIETREGAVVDAIQAGKMALFIDQWNTAWGSAGKYDPVNAPDPKHPFMGNEIWMTYEEAIVVMKDTSVVLRGEDAMGYLCNTNARAHLPFLVPAQFNANRIVHAASLLEVFNPKVSLSSILISFYACPKLRIIKTLDVTHATRIDLTHSFHALPALETLELKGLKLSVSIPDSPLLSLASLQYLVNNAANTSTITVTVHPEVYAKLTDETNTEWNAIFTAAEARQIEFVTTE